MKVADRERVEEEIGRLLRERVARLRASLEALTEELQQPLSLEGVLEEESTPVAPSTPEEGPSSLAVLVQDLAAAQDQITLLDRFLQATHQFSSRACLFIVRGRFAQGWSSRGLRGQEGKDAAKGISVSLNENSILRSAVEEGKAVQECSGEGGIEVLPDHLGGDRAPQRALAVPLLVKGRTAAVLYADDGGNEGTTFDFGSIEVLAQVTTLGANLLALKTGRLESQPEVSTKVQVRVPTETEMPPEPPAQSFLAVDPLEEDLGETPSLSPLPPIPADLSPDEARLHEEARRFARLLVSELLLYNEDLVVLGRKNQDIYIRLKDDIDRSWETYDQRVPPAVSDRSNYFRDELVRTLAAGDVTALGEDFPI